MTAKEIALVSQGTGYGIIIGLGALFAILILISVRIQKRAIEHTPVFVTYPDHMTPAQINSGLVMPFVLKSLFGSSACVGVLVLIFMDITSTVSSSLIAVSSIVSFDFYRTYFNRNATDRQILTVSHAAVVGYGFVIAGWTLAMNYAGANGNWILYFLPVTTSPGIFPVIFTLLWSRQTKEAAIISPLVGLAAGIGTWIGLSYSMFGAVSIATTSEQMPALYGSLVSLFTPAILSIVISFIRPHKFDWREFLRADLIEDKSRDNSATVSSRASQVNADEKSEDLAKDNSPIQDNGIKEATYSAEQLSSRNTSQDLVHPFDEATLRHVRKWLKIAIAFLIVNVLVTIIVWPLPLYRDYIFSRTFFASWVTVSILWQFFALFALVIYPLFDGRHAIGKGVKGLWLDLRKRAQGKKE